MSSCTIAIHIGRSNSSKTLSSCEVRRVAALLLLESIQPGNLFRRQASVTTNDMFKWLTKLCRIQLEGLKVTLIQ